MGEALRALESVAVVGGDLVSVTLEEGLNQIPHRLGRKWRGFISVDSHGHASAPRPRLFAGSTTVVSCQAEDGQPATCVRVLQDGYPRYFDDTITNTPTLSANTWYYVYLVPSSGDLLKLEVSTTAPGSNTNALWEYVGCFRSDGSSLIRKFDQVGAETKYRSSHEFSASSSLTKTVLQAKGNLSCSDLIPPTAVAGILSHWVHRDTSAAGSGGIFQQLYVDGESSDFSGVYTGDDASQWVSGALMFPFPTSTKQIQYEVTRTGGASALPQDQGVSCKGFVDGWLVHELARNRVSLIASQNQTDRDRLITAYAMRDGAAKLWVF